MRVSEMFYREVVQAVLLFGTDNWVLLAEISRKLKGVHVGFLRHVTGQKANWQRDGTWRSASAAGVQMEAGTKTLETYIDKQQETVSE